MEQQVSSPQALAADPGDVPSRVAAARLAGVIERAGAQYVAELQALARLLSEDYRRLYAAQLAATEAQLAAKEETIAELRRRAALAERALQLPQAALGVDGAGGARAAAEAPSAPGGLLGGLWRRWRWVGGP